MWHMWIEWLGKYKYFVNLRKMCQNVNKNYLLYCNIILFWPLLTSWFLSPPPPAFISLISFTAPHQRVHDFFHPPYSSAHPLPEIMMALQIYRSYIYQIYHSVWEQINPKWCSWVGWHMWSGYIWDHLKLFIFFPTRNIVLIRDRGGKSRAPNQYIRCSHLPISMLWTRDTIKYFPISSTICSLKTCHQFFPAHAGVFWK